MNDEIKDIIKQSSFEVIDGIYAYVKVNKLPNPNTHFLVTQDKEEITVVTTEDKLGELDLIERNKDTYKLISLNVSVPFYSIGFLATVSSAIADKGMNILIVSTYSKDYIMVKDDKLEDAKRVLSSLGFKN